MHPNTYPHLSFGMYTCKSARTHTHTHTHTKLYTHLVPSLWAQALQTLSALFSEVGRENPHLACLASLT